MRHLLLSTLLLSMIPTLAMAQEDNCTYVSLHRVFAFPDSFNGTCITFKAYASHEYEGPTLWLNEESRVEYMDSNGIWVKGETFGWDLDFSQGYTGYCLVSGTLFVNEVVNLYSRGPRLSNVTFLECENADLSPW
ncbi:MAG: hypothetical protein D6E12_12310 [Desulfovibrio sp.]|nr:MAG: hypothetical protein D6E12_12310 [Desulfovibrio sp.]